MPPPMITTSAVRDMPRTAFSSRCAGQPVPGARGRENTMPGPFTRRGMVARACYNRPPSDRIHSLGIFVKPFPARADLDVAPDERPDGYPGRHPLLARRRDP